MKRWADIFSGAGAVALSLLACAGCPLCFPLYAACLSVIGNVMGIELVDTHHFFLPVAMALSCISLGVMAYQIRAHHGLWMPFKVAAGAAGGMMVAAYFNYEYLLYASLLLFMGGVLWNKRTLLAGHENKKCC